MAGSSIGSRNGDALEVLKSATTSILSDDGLPVPTERAKLCLEISNKFRDFFEDSSEEGITFAKQLVFQLKQILEQQKISIKRKCELTFTS